MTEPTPIGTRRRRYDKRTKARAVVEAENSSVLAASQKLGIPRKTLEYWVESPAYATLRQKTKEDLAGGSIVLAHLAQVELARRIEAGEVEPRDLAVIYGIAIDKGQLLSGEATSRNEIRDITAQISDHEWDQLTSILREAAEA